MEYRARNLEKQLAYREQYKEREAELARQRHAENPGVRRADTKRWQEANPEKVKAANAAIYAADPVAARARVEAWRLANPEQAKARADEWRKANPDKVKAVNLRQYAKADKVKLRRQKRVWQNENRDKVRASVSKWNKEHPGCTAKRKATKLNATPSWANKFFIEEAYHLAKMRTEMLGFTWQVDHIVPLLSKSVCGLHCEANLQVIPGRENAAKGNRVWPDMPTTLSA